MSGRIALVVPEYRTDVAPAGGVSTVADFVCAALASVPGWKVEVFSPRMWNRAPESQRIRDPRSWFRGPTARVVDADGISVTYVGSHFAEIELLRFRSRRILRDLLSPFDLLFVVSGSPAAFETLRGLEAPILAQVATTVQMERTRLVTQGSLIRRMYARINRRITYRLDRTGVRIPDLILVENPWMEDWCRARGARDVRIELPGVDTDFFSPQKPASGSQDPGYIVSVGRLDDPRKDFGLLVRAYGHAVRRHGIDQRLVIAGRNDLPTEVYHTIELLDLSSRVDVRRDLSPEELRDTYREADVFAMSSSEEGLGLVLVEALACGTPIVSTATEGANSVVRVAGTGVVVRFSETVDIELGDAIAALAADVEGRKRLSQQSRLAAVTHFSLQSTGKHFREAVGSLL